MQSIHTNIFKKEPEVNCLLTQTQAIHFCTTKLFNAVETVHCQINDYRAGKHRDTKLSDSKKMDIMKKLNVSNSNLWPSDYKSN